MSQTSDPYFCIVVLPDQPVADLCVLDAAEDAGAMGAAAQVAREWPDYLRVEVYRGERRVGALHAAEDGHRLPQAA